MIIASDFGYGYTKACSNKDFIKFPSLLSKARNIRFVSEIASDASDLEKLWVDLDGNEFFVGKLAYSQGTEIIQVLHKDKFLHKSTEIIMKSALGYISKNFQGSPKEFDCISGLPVSFCTSEAKENLANMLRGSHEITFKRDLVKKDPEKVLFSINDVKIMPQPLGSLFHVILDQNGNFKDDSVDLASGSIAIIDIGFGTTDFTIIDNLEYIDKYSRSINSAVSNVCSNLSNVLSEQIQEEIPVYDIQNSLYNKEIVIGSQRIDLKDAIDKVVDDVFQEIYSQGQALWKQKKSISCFIVTGGGAHLFFEKFKETFGPEYDIRTVKDIDSSFANVSGFYKYMTRIEKKK